MLRKKIGIVTKSLLTLQQKSISPTALLQTRNAITTPSQVQDDTLTPVGWSTARPFSEIPTESTFKFMRRFIKGGKNYNQDLIHMLKSLREEYGDMFVMHMLGKPPTVITHCPKDAEVVYRNEGIWPTRSVMETLKHYREEYRKDFFQGSEGLVTTNGEKWGHFRSIVNPILMQSRNVQLYMQKMSDVNLEFIERIKTIRNASTLEVPDTFRNELNQFTLESVAVVAVDKKLGLITNDPPNIRAQDLFKNLETFFTLGYELELRPSLWKWFSTPAYKQLMKSMDHIKDITSSFVEEAMETLKQEKAAGYSRPLHEQSILEKLLAIDSKVAKIMAMDLLLAGADTTTSAILGVLLSIAKNPEKQEKLREEVMRVLPQKDSSFADKSLDSLPYLRACIKEALRLYPVAPVGVRRTKNDVVLSGYQVPKNLDIYMVTVAISRESKYFVQPNDYLPERWLRENQHLKLQNSFAFLPFGFGPRICVGKRIVDLEMELALARLVRNFKIEYNYPAENPFKSYFVPVFKIPPRFKFIDID